VNKQNKPVFGYVINHFGCYAWALAKKVESRIRPNKPFTDQELLDFVKIAETTGILGYLDEEGKFHAGKKFDQYGTPVDGCYVKDPGAWLELLGAMARVRTRTLADGTVTTSFPPDWPDIGDAEVIQRWENPNFGHFVDGKNASEVDWDPIDYGDGKGSNTVRTGKVVSLRLVDFLASKVGA
jgi:hypothetical protein